MVQAAWELLREAYQYQEGEDYDMAEELYKRSIKLHPTAEAYTFLGGPIIIKASSMRRSKSAERPFTSTRISAPPITISART